MKRFLILLSTLFCAVANADTITVNWDNGDQTYTTTTCEAGDDIVLPTIQTKRGYTFQGWKLSPYMPLEYIENAPSGTYFNTGFYPNENSIAVVDFVLLQYGSGDCPVIKPSVNNVPVADIFSITASLNSSYQWHTKLSFNYKYKYCANCSSTHRKHYLNKNTISSEKDKYFTSTTPILIFANNTSSLTSCRIRLYSIQLYQGDELVHDYAPARKSDGTVCLYDKVTGDFLYNLGTTDPVAGPAL